MPSRPGEELGRLPAGVGRHPVARAALVVGQLDLGRVDRDAGQRREASEQLRDRRPQLRGRRGDGDADDRGGRAGAAQPDEEAGLGAAGRRRDHDGRRLDAGGRSLPRELDPGEDLAGGADRDPCRRPRRGTAASPPPGDPRRPARRAPRGRRVRRFGRRGPSRPSSASSRSFGPGRVGRRAGQDEVDVETRLRPGGGRQPAVVRPAAAGRDERVGAVGKRRPDEELQVPQLVAAERERQEVLALDPDVGPAAQRGREPRQRLERRGPVEEGEPRQAGDPGGHVDLIHGGIVVATRPSTMVAMARRITPAERTTSAGQNTDMERSIAVSADTVGSVGLYSSVVTTAPGGRTRIHHHGECETSIFILSGPGPLHVGTDRPRAGDGGRRRRLRLHPRRRGPRRGERVGDGAARRRPDPELPGIGRPLPRRGVSDARVRDRWPKSFGATAWPTSRERPFPNDGWSGASLTLLRRGGERFVLKRTRSPGTGSLARRGWADPPRGVVRRPRPGVARADPGAVPGRRHGGRRIRHPHAGPDRRPVRLGCADVGRVPGPGAGRPGELHPTRGRRPWQAITTWCPLRERVTLICRASPGAPWSRPRRRRRPDPPGLGRVRPAGVRPAARHLIDSLGEDPQPLLDALADLPSTLLHGDLKLANVGIEPDGSIDMVDWQMVIVAPVAVELGWFLVSNVASLPLQPVAVLERYHDAMRDRARADSSPSPGAIRSMPQSSSGFCSEAGAREPTRRPA